MMNRRTALKSSAAGLAAASMMNAHAFGVADQKTHRVGLIGAGWYGKSDTFRLIQVAPVEVVSICDVDKHLLQDAADRIAKRQKSGKTPRTYGDYREMLKEKDLDIVIVGTPDHWHALPTIAAIEAGADVYVQKPISHDVLEGEAMLAAARKHKRVVQVGTQHRSMPHLVKAKKEIIDSGKLGKIGHIELCCYHHMRANDDRPETDVPDFLDYEMWCGPAPKRPYDGLPHRRWWRTFMEYGNGIVGDMCVHVLDLTRWMLDLKWPKSIGSSGGIRVQTGGKSNISDTQVATFEYPDFDIVWQHRTWGNPVDPDYPWGLFIYGEKGTLKASTKRADFIPQGKGDSIHFDCVIEKEKYPEDVDEPDMEFNAAPATRAHMKDFLAAIESRGRPVADIEEGHISTASCILANLSMQLNRPLVYDPKTQSIVEDGQATKLLKQSYREPWKHPAEADD